MNDYRKVNVYSTLKLACRAVAAGVKRKVRGEATCPGRLFTREFSHCGAFALSEFGVEQAQLEAAKQTSMDLEFIRLVLVHGPGGKANHLNFMRWLDKAWALLLAIYNCRNLVALYNLGNLINICISYPRAANGVLLISDSENVSRATSSQIFTSLVSVHVRLVPVSSRILKLGVLLFGSRDSLQRLRGLLQVDIEKTRTLFDWAPVTCVDCALASAAYYYQGNSRK